MRKRQKPQKNKQPSKSKDPLENKDSGSEEEFERRTQEDAELVPPARRPPTAVGAGTPPLPPRPAGPSRSTPEPHRRPPLFRLLQTVRAAVAVVLDLADAAVDAVTKGLPRRNRGRRPPTSG